MQFSEEIYRKFINIFHPKFRANIHKFKDGGFYYLPRYCGCGKKRNRNDTRKKIDYSNGEICSKGTYDFNWKGYDKINFKKLPSKFYFTRYMTEIGLHALAKNKGYLWFD